MLEAKLKSLPQSAGVYQYFNAQGKLLYVGKAKNLKNRVKSYFSFTPKLAPNPKNSLRIQKMIQETTHLEYISTTSEADALILENSFIKQLRPKYNILLRDDKTYPYIYFDLNEDFALPKITRKIIKKPHIRYFGPFFKGARELLNALFLSFKLRQKSSCKKACIFYQISRCAAPCEGKISKAEYELILKQAINALLNPNILIKNLEQKMFFLAQNENYEEAAKLRDSIATIRDLQVKVAIDIARLEDFDVFALASEGTLLVMQRFVVQNGKVISSNHKLIALKDKEELDFNEIYKQVLLESFPKDSPISSKSIYVAHDFDDLTLLEELLSARFAKNIRIKCPKIGEKRRICNLAMQNAKIHLTSLSKDENLAFLREFKEFFSLENLPQNIEVFDNSHLQGKANVGAMITYKIKDFDKSAYRLYHLDHSNDYEQMKEVLTRRVKDFDKLAAPDLWVLDGGKALLDLALAILESVGANVDVLAIAKEKVDAKAYRAKGRAKDTIYTQKGILKLSTSDKKLLFLQKLRDEAHRFAINFHQSTKRKRDLQSSKLENLGLSKAEIQKALNHFGDFESIHRASFEELKEFCGLKIAKKLKLNS